MPGITLSSSSSQLETLRGSFRHYAEWYTDAHPDANAAELFVDQGRKFATELYVQTAAIAPSNSEIASDVKAQGWEIPVKFADGRLGRGVAAQWLGYAWQKIVKGSPRRRGRPRKGETAAREAGEEAFLSRKPTLAEMQAAVIKWRQNARLFLASGWLGAIADLGGSLSASSGKVDRGRGGAEIRHSAGLTEIILWNRTPGIETMNEQKGFVAKAIAVRAADMLVYVQRKMDEAARRYFRAA